MKTGEQIYNEIERLRSIRMDQICGPIIVDILSNCLPNTSHREEWVKSGGRIQYSRYNHASVTVPGDMFPQCD